MAPQPAAAAMTTDSPPANRPQRAAGPRHPAPEVAGVKLVQFAAATLVGLVVAAAVVTVKAATKAAAALPQRAAQDAGRNWPTAAARAQQQAPYHLADSVRVTAAGTAARCPS